MSELDDIRRAYAQAILAAANVRSDRLAAAFAKVPREHFLGPGPWQILDPDSHDAEYRITDANPAHLYHDVLVAIDPARRLNNGQPSYLAFCLRRSRSSEGGLRSPRGLRRWLLHGDCSRGRWTRRARDRCPRLMLALPNVLATTFLLSSTWRSFKRMVANTIPVPAMRSSSTLARRTRDPSGWTAFDRVGGSFSS